jgi:hypothetical protein
MQFPAQTADVATADMIMTREANTHHPSGGGTRLRRQLSVPLVVNICGRTRRSGQSSHDRPSMTGQRARISQVIVLLESKAKAIVASVWLGYIHHASVS